MASEKEVKSAWYTFVFVLISILVIAAICFNGSYSNRITTEKAINRFAEISGVEEKDIVIIRNSNMDYLTGNPHDVTFELKIKGKNVSARCTSDWFSPMVCRLYDN